MTTEALRRYLQPSGQLRWHPWAPIVVLILALGFSFAFGARWGFEAAKRAHEHQILGSAFLAKSRVEMQMRGDPRAPTWDANSIDQLVASWASKPYEDPGWFGQQLRRVEDYFIYGWSPVRRAKLDSTVKSLAEFRLANLAGEALAWQATSRYCDVTPKYPMPQNLGDRYVRVADAYSKILGRRIAPERLAPAVPGGTCPGFL